MKTQSTINHLNTGTSSKVRTSNRTGNLVQSFVTSVFNDKVAIQLGNNGPIMHNLKLIGGPVKAGDAVQVDFFSDPPIAIAKGTEYMTESDLEAALKKLVTGASNGMARLEITLFSGGTLNAIFPPTEDGMASAILAATEGDVIWFPDIEIETDVTVPDGVTLSGVSSRQSIIKGTITLGNDSTLENLKIVAIGTGGGDLVAVDVTATTRPAQIKNCEIHSYQCVSGTAYGVDMAVNGWLEVQQSSVIAATSSGASYAFQGALSSYAKVTHCRIYADTEWFFTNGSFDVYSNVEGDSELQWWCIVEFGYHTSGSSGYSNQSETDYYFNKLITPPSSPATSTMFSSSLTAAAYPGTIARIDNYIYINKYGTPHQIREVNIDDNTTVDVTVDREYTKFIAVGGRQVLFFGHTGDNHIIKSIDFSTATITTEHTFAQDDGDYTTEDTDSFDYATYTVAVTDENGDLFVVFIGNLTTYYLAADFYGSAGVYFLAKNWTQGGAWTMVKQILKPTSNWYSDYAYLYTPPAAVQSRYVTLVPSWDVSGAETWPGFTTAHGGNAYRVMVALDLTDYSVSITRDPFTRSGSFPDPEFYYYGVDHANGFVFAHYYDSTHLRMYKFDPVGSAITLHTSIVSPSDVIYLFNNENCYYMKMNSVGSANIYRCNALTLALNWSLPAFIYFETDWVMDSDNNFWFFNPTNGNITSVNPETAAESSFASGVTPAALTPSRNFLYALGDVFVVFVNKTAGSLREHYLIKES